MIPNSTLLLLFFVLAIPPHLSIVTPMALEPQQSLVNVSGNSTALSPNGTFAIGFLTLDAGSTFYLAIWYASIPIRTVVWLANRHSPVRSPPPSASLTPDGRFSITDSNAAVLWSTDNRTPAADARLLDNGNLVLLSPDGRTAWQSFDFPSDTWLPDMTVTADRPLVSWRSPSDPSPGLYSLRLRPPDYGEFELVFNGSVRYWSTGNWTGARFANVPEMTVPYIYSFRFSSPFTPSAAFSYSETPPAETTLGPLLSRFVVGPAGRLMQYTWSPQAASWNMFWSRPESQCRVYGRCGSLGMCVGGMRACDCPSGLRPAEEAAWRSGDFSAGCRSSSSPCGGGGDDGDDDGFEEMGAVEMEGATSVSFPAGSLDSCEESCRRNCSCVGVTFDDTGTTKLCTNLYGSAYNLRNSTGFPVLHLRVSPGDGGSAIEKKTKKSKERSIPIIAAICCFLIVSGSVAIFLLAIRRKRRREAGEDEEEVEGDFFPVTNLKVFTYKELSAATRGFSEKLGHGGFGAVFRGELPPDSTPVAVKRLERPGGGDREFRAEVRTIGSVQHVNLVRLRGFCSEEPHRLLVYDYMPNGPLSSYLTGRAGQAQPQPQLRSLTWPARFRIAVGTARGIAYLHEECRDCIIHCDIKPENILLDGDYTPKVSDFGLAKLMGRDLSRVLATMRGTWGYVAPEWISGVAITAKADVYSYGMTLLEILGGRRNVEAPPPAAAAAAAGGEEGWYFPPWAARRIVEGDVAGVVDPEMEGLDVREAERAGLVAVWCIQDEEAARPTMGAVVKMLEGTVEVTVPPLPQLIQALITGESFRRAGIASGEVSTESVDEISAEPDEPSRRGRVGR